MSDVKRERSAIRREVEQAVLDWKRSFGGGMLGFDNAYFAAELLTPAQRPDGWRARALGRVRGRADRTA